MHHKLIPDPRSLFNFGKQPKTAIACKEFFHKSGISKEIYQQVLKKITLFFFRTACHPYFTRMSFVCHSYVPVSHPHVSRIYSYFIRTSLICTRMSSVRMYSYVIRMLIVCTCMTSVCHSYVLVCHPYVICMSLVCTRMSSVCHSHVLLCHPYVIHMWFYHEP